VSFLATSHVCKRSNHMQIPERRAKFRTQAQALWYLSFPLANAYATMPCSYAMQE